MFFEEPIKCPFLEDEESIWANIPYCVIVYGELTAWTLTELCRKDFKKRPAYIKTMNKCNEKGRT